MYIRNDIDTKLFEKQLQEVKEGWNNIHQSFSIEEVETCDINNHHIEKGDTAIYDIKNETYVSYIAGIIKFTPNEGVNLIMVILFIRFILSIIINLQKEKMVFVLTKKRLDRI